MHTPVRGVSFIDVIVGTFIVLVVFMTLFGLLRASLVLSSAAKARATATSVATSQMEYIRSLSYDSVGTVGGIPAGEVPQYATTTVDGVPFAMRTYIDYVDDEADGVGAADTTGITTDYKRVKVSVTYMLNSRMREVAIITNVVPPGLETSTGGGTLKIDVVSATGVAIPGASVRIVNSSISPSVDVTTFSNALGIVYLPGAATSSEYQVTVTKSGYSSAQTYARDATNQNPTPGYLTVAKDQTTTGTFAIDTLADFVLRTFSPLERATTTDSFADASGLAASANTTVAGSEVALSGVVGTYPSSGSARSTSITSAYLAGWGDVEAVLTAPASTDVRIHITDASGARLPESALPGNSTGFVVFPVSLSGVSTSTYPALSLEAALTTSSASSTPSVQAWSLSYDEGPVPLPDVSFTLLGAKTVGSTGVGAPIYKTTVSEETDAEGMWSGSLEWDAYSFDIPDYDVIDACNAPPYTLAPGSSTESSLTLGAPTAHSILVSVRDAAGVPVQGADVTLSRTGYAETAATSACGTAYFGALTSSSAYTVQVVKSGYTTQTYTPVSVSGTVFYAASIE